jgi:hypothetical protein
MRPDTSRWRAQSSYDFVDRAPVDHLAWECLRRNHDYQQDYAELHRQGSLEQPLPDRMKDRWGLRFRGPARPLRPRSGGALVGKC